MPQKLSLAEFEKLAFSAENCVNLSIGQPAFGPSQEVKNAAIAAINQGFSRYTPFAGLPELREAVAQKLRQKNGLRVTAEKILITPGVSAGLHLTLITIVNPGDEVVLPDPYYLGYLPLLTAVRAKPIFVSTYPDFQLTAARVRKALTNRTKVLLINTPANPTGSVTTAKNLKEIAEQLSGKVTVISDEIYEDFRYNGAEHFSLGSVYEKTVTLNGLSKSAGIPGWRVGYAAGPERIIKKMLELQPYTYVHAPSISQKAALVALNGLSQNELLHYQRRRDWLVQELHGLYDFVPPQGAFYAFLKTPPDETGSSFVRRALQNGLLIWPGSFFSQSDTHVRISFSTDDETLKRGLQILKELR